MKISLSMLQNQSAFKHKRQCLKWSDVFWRVSFLSIGHQHFLICCVSWFCCASKTSCIEPRFPCWWSIHEWAHGFLLPTPCTTLLASKKGSKQTFHFTPFSRSSNQCCSPLPTTQQVSSVRYISKRHDACPGRNPGFELSVWLSTGCDSFDEPVDITVSLSMLQNQSAFKHGKQRQSFVSQAEFWLAVFLSFRFTVHFEGWKLHFWWGNHMQMIFFIWSSCERDIFRGWFFHCKQSLMVHCFLCLWQYFAPRFPRAEESEIRNAARKAKAKRRKERRQALQLQEWMNKTILEVSWLA